MEVGEEESRTQCEWMCVSRTWGIYRHPSSDLRLPLLPFCAPGAFFFIFGALVAVKCTPGASILRPRRKNPERNGFCASLWPKNAHGTQKSREEFHFVPSHSKNAPQAQKYREDMKFAPQDPSFCARTCFASTSSRLRLILSPFHPFYFISWAPFASTSSRTYNHKGKEQKGTKSNRKP